MQLSNIRLGRSQASIGHRGRERGGAPSSRKATRAVTGTVAQWQVSHRVKGSSDSLRGGREGQLAG